MNKTLHLTNAYHSASGGIRTFYRALLDGAARRQRAVRLVVPGERTTVEDVNPWARIYHVEAPPSAFIDRRYRLLLPHRYLFGRSGPLWQILHDESPDLIEVCDKYALIYLGGLIRGRWLPHRQRPAVAALTCERMDDNVETFVSRHPLARRFARWYMRHVYLPQFDAHVAVSSYAAGELPAGHRPIAIAPMGLDSSVFTVQSPTPAGRRRVFGDLGRDRRAILLLYVGRLSAEKQLPLLLDMMAALPTRQDRVFHLLVAGDGPLRPWLTERAGAVAPGRVHLLGHVTGRDALARVYANADLLVHPNAHEPYGLVPLEAMASGLPVVLPRAGGVLEYATDGKCLADCPAGGGNGRYGAHRAVAPG